MKEAKDQVTFLSFSTEYAWVSTKDHKENKSK